jgi:hypothetical protein
MSSWGDQNVYVNPNPGRLMSAVELGASEPMGLDMRYIKVIWKHQQRDDPIRLYSELNDESWEVRKVEVFRDGFLGYASRSESRGSTFLGLVPVPPLAEIAADPEFEPKEIEKGEFDEMWLKATRGERRSGGN